MAILRARVKDGHVEDEMTAEERADLDAAIERGRADIAAGRGIPSADLLDRVRTS